MSKSLKIRVRHDVNIARCTNFRLPSQWNLIGHRPTYLTFLPLLGLPTLNIIQDNCSHRPPPHAILPTHNNIRDICGRKPPTKKTKKERPGIGSQPGEVHCRYIGNSVRTKPSPHYGSVVKTAAVVSVAAATPTKHATHLIRTAMLVFLG